MILLGDEVPGVPVTRIIMTSLCFSLILVSVFGTLTAFVGDNLPAFALLRILTGMGGMVRQANSSRKYIERVSFRNCKIMSYNLW
jgi:hypothetical protein